MKLQTRVEAREEETWRYVPWVSIVYGVAEQKFVAERPGCTVLYWRKY